MSFSQGLVIGSYTPWCTILNDHDTLKFTSSGSSCLLRLLAVPTFHLTSSLPSYLPPTYTFLDNVPLTYDTDISWHDHINYSIDNIIYVANIIADSYSGSNAKTYKL